MRLKYVVITSVDRDDLRDGGAQHFADCLREIRKLSPSIQLETLVPDYRGRMEIALDITATEPPDVFNHNLETVPRLYKSSRPGSDFEWSLDLLEKFKQRVPGVPTKSGLMLGLGETDEEVIEVMQRMREHRHADPRPVSAAVAQPSAGAALRAPGHLRLVCRGRHEDGLQERRLGPAGALLVPRRPAGSRRQARLIGPGGPSFQESRAGVESPPRLFVARVAESVRFASEALARNCGITPH